MNDVNEMDSNPMDGFSISPNLQKLLTTEPLETIDDPLNKWMNRAIMPLLRPMIERIRTIRYNFDRLMLERRWAKLRKKGLRLGTDVCIPGSTWIDPDFCHLISIGDHCGFGPDCLILAHDAQMDEFLDAGRIGQVIIHESCHIGARSVLLPGIEIGPRTIVGANSVVTKTLPANSVCAGNPAKVICSLDAYLVKHQKKISESVTFPYMKGESGPDLSKRMMEATLRKPAYVTGGRSAELRGEGGTLRTKSPNVKVPGWRALFTGF